MRIRFRRFWWLALLAFVSATLISWQIFVKSVSVQAQTTANLIIKPVLWQDRALANGQFYSSAESACEAYRKDFIEGSSHWDSASLVSITKPVPTVTGTIGNAARCSFIVGQKSPPGQTTFDRLADLVCPSGYSYSGKTDGTDTDGVCYQLPQNDPAPKHWLSDDVKKLLNKAALPYYGAGAASALSALLACGPAIPACATVFGVMASVLPLIGATLQYATIDPPDPNYTIVYQPVFPSLPDSQIQYGLNQAEVNDFNAFIKNKLQTIGFANAIHVSYNRASTASDAGNQTWKLKQLEAVKQYMQQLGNLLDAEPTLSTKLVTTLQVNRFPNITVNASDISSFQSNVKSNGLPNSVIQGLKQLGADSNTIEQIRQFIIIQDPNTVQGSYPQKLVNQSLFDTLHQAEQILKSNPFVPGIN